MVMEVISVMVVVVRLLVVRVDATHFSFSDSNSPLQGIPKYEIRMPCKVLGQLDQFVLGPHPPPWGKGVEVFSSCS